MSLLPLVIANPTRHRWFWLAADIATAVLVLANLLLIVFIYLRRLREGVRARRAASFQARFAPIVEQVVSGAAPLESEELHREVGALDELERPLAAAMLLEWLRPASPEERRRILVLLRAAGATDLLLRGTRRFRPWRRALAIRTLGWLGEERAVPVLLERLRDRNRYVREAAVRALGRIGDERALLPLEQIYLDPQRNVAAGFIYEAVAAFGESASPAFRQGLISADEQIRVASCYGVGAVLPPQRASPLLEGMLEDGAPAVRAAALELLGRPGGKQVPSLLARCSRDYQPSVRRAAASALGSYDDPHALEILQGVLLDPDRDTVIRAGESLVRLSRLPGPVGTQARELLATSDAWVVERAQTLASLGAL